MEANRVTLDPARRDEAIAAAYESARERLGGITAAEFAEGLAGWDVHPATVDGAIVGAVVVRGKELHACVIPEACGRWFKRREAAILAGVIAEHGCAVTTATTDAGRRFVERLGFVQAGDVFIKGP